MVTFTGLHRLLQVGLGSLAALAVLGLALTDGNGLAALGDRPQGEAVTRLSNYDGAGQSLDVTYPKPPRRVLVTYPGATELLIDLGLADSIVGTVKPYGPEPATLQAAYDSLPIMSAPFVPTREEVLDLQPDLIMAWSHHFEANALGTVDQWLSRHIATYIVPATVRKGYPTIESTLYPFIDDIGAMYGIEDKARAYRKNLEERVGRVEKASRYVEAKPTVLVLQLHGNSTYSVYGRPYVIYDVVEKAGGRMVTDQQLNSVGPERVLAYDPDYIVLVVTGLDRLEDLDKATQILAADPQLKSLRAIRAGHIIPVEFSQVNNGNGRMVDALESIHKGLYTY